ncbi:hypothetical protein Gotri_024758, partial [Gossypium trilobum]|nr:hypothetical protein [Gossypium trilobum]
MKLSRFLVIGSFMGINALAIFSGSHATLEGTWMYLFTDGTVARDNGNAPTSGVLRD